MTIRVNIQNADSREEAIIGVKTVDSVSGEPVAGVPNPKELKGGESTEAWVHSGQKLIIEEVKNG